MAHDNFEDILKERLESRRIAPSDNAWERVSAHKQPKRKMSFYWYGSVAASVLLVAGWLWTKVEPTIPASPTVVTAPEKNLEIQKDEREIRTAVRQPALPQGQAIAIATPEATETPDVTEAIAATDTPSVAQNEAQKIQEIVAALDQIQDDGQAITEATVDSLLAKAQRELALEKQQRGRTDPNALLADAEAEVDMSFKDRVFTAISKFRKVRVAFGNK